MNLKPIPGYEGFYSASDCGHVFRVATRMGEPICRQIAERMKKGYAIAHLCREAKRRDRPVHRCVWEAHKGPIPKGLEINHINGVRNDNRIENLELVTKSGNALHKFNVLGYRSRGRGVLGSKSRKAKFVEADIPSIRSRAANGEGYKSIAADYGTTPEAIGYIVRRQTWRHVA